MNYKHWFMDCPQHENCILHVGEGQTEVDGETYEYRTESHAPDDHNPAYRLNIDYPEADNRLKGAKPNEKIKWKLPSKEFAEREDTGIDEAGRRTLAEEAVRRGLLKREQLHEEFFDD